MSTLSLSRSAFFTVALGAAALLCAPHLRAAPKDKEKKPEPPPGPAVTLRVSTHHGFRPLTLTLTGTLIGVSASDPEFCHAGIEWVGDTPGGRVIVSRQDPKCLHPPEQVAVQFSYEKMITLDDPGLYNYRFLLYRRDGSRLESTSQEVRVMDVP